MLFCFVFWCYFSSSFTCYFIREFWTVVTKSNHCILGSINGYLRAHYIVSSLHICHICHILPRGILVRGKAPALLHLFFFNNVYKLKFCLVFFSCLMLILFYQMVMNHNNINLLRTLYAHMWSHQPKAYCDSHCQPTCLVTY